MYKTHQTNSTIYLSDGTHWKHHQFAQNVNLIRAFMLRETECDENIQAVRKEIADRKKLLKMELEKLIDTTIDPFEIMKKSTALMRFGKYKGKRLCDIHNQDPKYLIWLINLDNYDLELTLKLGSLPIKIDKPLDITKKVDLIDISQIDDGLPF